MDISATHQEIADHFSSIWNKSVTRKTVSNILREEINSINQIERQKISRTKHPD